MNNELDLGDGHKIVFAEYQGERAGGNVKHPPVAGKCSGDGWVPFALIKRRLTELRVQRLKGKS